MSQIWLIYFALLRLRTCKTQPHQLSLLSLWLYVVYTGRWISLGFPLCSYPTNLEDFGCCLSNGPLSGAIFVGSIIPATALAQFKCQCSICSLPPCITCKISDKLPHSKCQLHLRRTRRRECDLTHPCHGCKALLKSEYAVAFRQSVEKLCRDRNRQRRSRQTQLEPLPTPSDEDSEGFVENTPVKEAISPLEKLESELFAGEESDGNCCSC